MKYRLYLRKLVFVVSILLFILAVFSTTMMHSTDETFIFGYKPILVTSKKKPEPCAINTLIITKKLDDRPIFINDSILYYSHIVKSYEMHRVVEISPDGYITEFNNNMVNHELVARSDILGIAVFHAHIPTWFITFIQSPIKLLLYIVAPMCMFYFAYLHYKGAKAT